MTDARIRRQRAIVELIRDGVIGSQEALSERLAGLGHTTTQATVSRDLEQLGAIKVRRNGAVAYALPDAAGSADWGSERFASIIRDWVQSVQPAGNLVVLKTPPGSAHLVGVALDQSTLPEVVGTICGDDTIFVALRSESAAVAFVAKLRSEAGLNTSG